ncbi:unnamed protein product [Rotaria sordida]|uniref:Pellino FHA domain-containing protein n=1 Tax=Rotaria sordida TaxID=392033 RepID=A0A819JKB5_9BILA|nr:unnamed protein product [Rotaria sordida]CAF3934266.1 unnamed protein product [Rotaria sordida]
MPDITTSDELQQQQIKYGELVVLGYNGQIPNGDRGRRKSKFQLRQRTQANGLKAQRQHLCKNADEVQVTKTVY